MEKAVKIALTAFGQIFSYFMVNFFHRSVDKNQNACQLVQNESSSIFSLDCKKMT